MKTLLFILGCVYMPAIYLGFLLSGLRVPLSDLYVSFFERYRSDEPFGPFDRK